MKIQATKQSLSVGDVVRVGDEKPKHQWVGFTYMLSALGTLSDEALASSCDESREEVVFFHVLFTGKFLQTTVFPSSRKYLKTSLLNARFVNPGNLHLPFDHSLCVLSECTTTLSLWLCNDWPILCT
jgi:hypothetical protein